MSWPGSTTTALPFGPFIEGSEKCTIGVGAEMEINNVGTKTWSMAPGM